MKRILLLLFFTLPLLVFSQEEINNIKINDVNTVVWSKVYESDINPEKYFTYLGSTGHFKDIIKTENSFTTNFHGVKPDYKGYGSSEMTTPMYIARSSMDGGVSVEFKEGRYRVILRNITLVQDYSDALTKMGERTKIEMYAVSKEKFKTAFKKKPSGILDYTFNKLFEYKKTDDNW